MNVQKILNDCHVVTDKTDMSLRLYSSVKFGLDNIAKDNNISTTKLINSILLEFVKTHDSQIEVIINDTVKSNQS